MQDVLRSPFLWLISLIFFCCNLQAGAFQEWAQLLLIQDRGFSTALGSGFTSAYNVGGTIGCIASGYITDRLVAMGPKRKTGSHRLKYLLLIVIVSICLQFYLLKLTTPQTPQYFILICAFVIGFCVYGNVSLNGVLVIENSPAYISGSAHAIAALAGNVGSVTAGFPLSYVSSMYDWSMTFLIVLTCSVVKLGLLLTASRIDLTIGRHSKTKAD
ncbi:putative glucose-6-phosphate translocase-like [Apostichopus japonicus]|uniref:Putative glucose-6-phosphate translocase-like n=1 Tax=Stichopus japonicus TaxID=307972 RepID=A0A2G8KAH5_STIJA|nr:putative glucose-6-phosphate translocase-like [Apostichopus japonicus]